MSGKVHDICMYHLNYTILHGIKVYKVKQLSLKCGQSSIFTVASAYGGHCVGAHFWVQGERNYGGSWTHAQSASRDEVWASFPMSRVRAYSRWFVVEKWGESIVPRSPAQCSCEL